MRVPDLSKGKILLMHSSIKTSLGADKYYFEELQVPSLMQKYEADIDSVCVYTMMVWSKVLSKLKEHI